jgi:hypothetical protein
MTNRPCERPIVGRQFLARVMPPRLVKFELFGADVVGAGPDALSGRVAEDDGP